MTDVMATPTSTLLNNFPSTYGTKFDDHLLEQYKLYVDSSQKLGDRRLSTNSYLFTINSSLLTLLGVLATLLPERRALAIIPAAGCLLSVAWALLLTSFKRLNTAKFHVIHKLEQCLPANVFAMEWEDLTNAPPRYKTMSNVERFVPLLFLLFYLIVTGFIWNLPSKAEKAQRLQFESPVRVELATPSAIFKQPTPPTPGR
jgi:hypothetical protein